MESGEDDGAGAGGSETFAAVVEHTQDTRSK